MDIIKFSDEELLSEFKRRNGVFDTSICVDTPAGPIKAAIIPDDEYPGIALVFARKGSGEPGVIMEFTPTGENAGNVQLRIYTRENPDDEPWKILRMS